MAVLPAGSILAAAADEKRIDPEIVEVETAGVLEVHEISYSMIQNLCGEVSYFVNEHFSEFSNPPSWGVFFITRIVLGKLAGALRNPAAARGFAGVLAALCLLFTLARNHVYRSEIALWEDAVRKAPHNARALNNLGYAYMLDGRDADAAKAYRGALRIDPGYRLAADNLAQLQQDEHFRVHQDE